MGDPTPRNLNDQTAEMLQAIQQYFPGAIDAINSKLTSTAQAQLGADQAVSPGYAALSNQILREYGPQAAEAGNAVQAVAQEGALRNQLSQLNGTGAQVAEAERALQEKIDPEYMKTRTAVANAGQQLISSMNGGAVSPTETEEMARGIGRTGQTLATSNLDTAKNAMTFGNAGHQRLLDFGNVLASVSGQVRPLGDASAPSTAPVQNIGVNRLAGPTQGSGQQAFNFGNNMWSGLQGYQNMINAKRKSLMDQVGQGMEIGGQFVGGVAKGLM